MAKLIIHLDDKQFEQLQTVIKHTAQTDLQHETFSGTDILIQMCTEGNLMEVSGYISEDLGFVRVEFVDEKNGRKKQEN